MYRAAFVGIVCCLPLLSAWAIDPAPLPPRKSQPVYQPVSAPDTVSLDLAPLPPSRKRLASNQTPQLSAPAAPIAPPALSSLQGANVELVKEIISLSRKDDMAGLKSIAARDKTLAGAIAQWLYLRNDKTDATLRENLAFRKAYAGFPQDDILDRRAEEAMWKENASPSTVLSFFAGKAPHSFEGRLALARAELASNRATAGRGRLHTMWHNERLTAEEEAEILKHFSRQFSNENNKIRFYNRLLEGDEAAARRVVRTMSPTEAQAAQALLSAQGAGVDGLGALSGSLRQSVAGQFVIAQAYRRAQRFIDAANVMHQAPTNPSQLINQDGWWRERKILIRNLLDARAYKDAYQVALDAASDDRADKADILFHRGWVALQYLKRPQEALKHFQAFEAQIFTPISLARAHYWQARALEDMGNGSAARAAYEKAAKQDFSYYGQLAMEEIGARKIRLSPKPTVSRDQIARFERQLDVQMLKALIAADGLYEAGALALYMAEHNRDITFRSYVADLMGRAGFTRYQVIIGKRALNDGQPLEAHAYPVPDYGRTRLHVDQALIYAIARQESEFNPFAVSRADARGLVQVLPGTARKVAREAGLSYNLQKLTSDPLYNLQIGSYYLNIRIKQFSGSLPMAIAAYNAGESRVEEWLGRFGDPRSSKDAIDWVERIPFGETRNYVQRVLENYQVYKALLAQKPLSLRADLYGKQNGQ